MRLLLNHLRLRLARAREPWETARDTLAADGSHPMHELAAHVTGPGDHVTPDAYWTRIESTEGHNAHWGGDVNASSNDFHVRVGSQHLFGHAPSAVIESVIEEAGRENCHACNTRHDSEHMNDAQHHHVRHVSNVRVCDDCASDGPYHTCKHCDNLSDDVKDVIIGHRRGRTRTAEWCPTCVKGASKQCSDCHNHYDPVGYAGGDNASGDPVCESCGENYTPCDSCGDVVHANVISGNGRCPACHTSHGDVLHDYDYKPKWNEHGDPRERKYGVELETETKPHHMRDDTVTAVLDHLNSYKGPEFAFAKEDGSLSDKGGAEIVTHPASLEEHKLRWPGILHPNHPTGLESEQRESTGLHIHVSRKGLTAGDIGKVVYFVNNPLHRDYMTKMAGRVTSYGKLEDKMNPAKGSKLNTDRRVAVNLQPSKTIEFRMFKGTLQPDAFFRALEFADASVNYAKQYGFRDMDDMEGFHRFLEAHRSRYTHLYPFTATFLGHTPIVPRPAPVRNSRPRPLVPVQMSVRVSYAKRRA